jgi:four helix bundle protein
MFLLLTHTKLEIFEKTKNLVLEIYRITKQFPSEERFALTQQIRRAAISVHLNVAEGFSRKSQLERKRFFEVSRSSLIELDTAIDIVQVLNYVKEEELVAAGVHIINCFKQLSALIASLQRDQTMR